MGNDSKLVLVLRKTRELLEDESGWCQGGTYAMSETTCRRCLSSAIEWAVHRVERGGHLKCAKLRIRVNEAIVQTLSFPRRRGEPGTNNSRIVEANDARSTTHGDVLSWIDEAIELELDGGIE